jgi:hypothetical protein
MGITDIREYTLQWHETHQVKQSKAKTCARKMDISETQFAEEAVFPYNVKSSFHYKLQII